MENELVSVIIPTYNREKTIKKSIKSVLDQTYSNIEVLVIDDASCDNTEKVVTDINDSRVKYYRLKVNSGACTARNYGIDKAKGKIVAFQDSDDIWYIEKLEKQIEYMYKNGYDFVSCGFKRIQKEDQQEIGIEKCPNNKIDLWCKLLNNNWISTQTIVCYKKCFEIIKFDPNIKRYQDWDLALQAVNYFKVGCLTEVLVDVYLQENSITNTVKTENAKLVVVNKHKKDIKDIHMKYQYYKSVADVTRKNRCQYARKHYGKCLKIKIHCVIFTTVFLTTTLWKFSNP